MTLCVYCGGHVTKSIVPDMHADLPLNVFVCEHFGIFLVARSKATRLSVSIACFIVFYFLSLLAYNQ